MRLRTPEYLKAWYDRTKGLVDYYLPGIAGLVHRQARGQAGGRTSPRKVAELEKMALAAITEANVRNLSNEELNSLHRRCHQLEGQIKEAT